MAEDDSSLSDLRPLVERLEHLEQVLQMHTERLYEVERRLDIDFRPTREPLRRRRKPLYESFTDERDDAAYTPPPVTPDERRTDTPPPQAAAQPAADAQQHAQADTPPSAPTDSQADARRQPFQTPPGTIFGATPYATHDGAQAKKRRVRDIEALVGGSWFNWLGIITIAFGVAFFLKEAFDNEWIGPRARVGLGAAAGVAILAVAERLRARGYRQYAYVLSGGGVLILYLSTYAAYSFYGMTGQAPAFLLMSSVTALAVMLSVRHDALPIAIIGLVGGFATPVLLSTGRDNQLALFTYVALLDAGVLAVAYFKHWRILNFLSFFATVAMFVGWMEKHYSTPKLWPTLFFLSLFFLLFSALAPVHNILRRRLARWHDVLLIIVNATFYFSLAYALLDEAGHGDWLGSFALVVSAFFLLLFYFAWTRHREDRLLAYSYAGAAVTFFTTAVAIQLDQHWVTIGWATEGLMLVWVGLRARERAARHAALAVFAVALAHWFGWDMRDFAFREGAAQFVPLFNRRALSCAALVAAFAASAWLYRRAGVWLEEEERLSVGNFFVLAAGALGLTLLTLDVNDYFSQRLARAARDDAERRAALENARQFSLTALWSLYGAAALVAGLLRHMRLLRYGALLLLGAVVLKVFALDVRYYAAPWHAPVFNHTFLAFALVIAALAAGARFYARAQYTPSGERAFVLPALTLAANLLAVAALSVEVAGYFDRATAALGEMGPGWDGAARLENNKWFAVSVVWTLYGAAAFALGARRGSKPVRYGALMLLAATTIKLLMLDLRYYAAPWHAPLFNQTFAAFALLVAALGLVIWLYGRAKGVDDTELSALRPVLVVAANLLAIIALSAEASGHFNALIRQGNLAADELRDLRLAQSLSLSVLWALYGGCMLAYGHVRRNKLLRVMALALLGLTTLKVFFWDLASLDKIYRIISFVVLGAILLAVSYLYQKKQRAGVEEGAQEG